MRKLFTIVLMTMMLSGLLSAQTETNVEALNKLSVEFAAEWDAAQARVQQFAAEFDVPITYTSPDGRFVEMVDIRDGQPVFYITDSHGAAITTRANEMWPGGSTGYNITGSGYNQLGQWDAGNVRVSHQEFTDQGPTRVTNQDGSNVHFHAVNVAGVMVAGGVSDNAKGSAYEGNLKAWNWNNDNSEMASAAANGLEVSNSSYGLLTGWDASSGSWKWWGSAAISPDEDYKFGFYTGDARAMDNIAHNAPYYLIVRSAGNDRGEGPSDAGTGDKAEKDGGDDGYDCISQDEIAKNVLTVGAVREVLDYTEPDDVVMTSFSCWGPADDGRIKPDICGKGIEVYTANSGADDSYTTTQGTSFSSPNVAASASLLQELYQTYSGGSPMRAATLKGLILHTADEAGSDPGPDYIFGWGLMNTKRAAQLITDDQGQNSIDELVLEGGDVYQRTITVPEGTPELRVSISWTDPAALPLPAQLNPRDPMLINNLDLKVFNTNDTYYPWKLDPENPSAAATNDSENEVDNIEVIVVTDPEPGTYTIFIDHNGALQGNEQAYSLIITGIEEYTVAPECAIGLNSPENGAVDILVNEFLTWEPASFASSYDIYFGTDGGGTQTPTNVYDGENISNNGFSYYMEPGTTYYLQVVPRNSQGAATGCDDIWSFTTMEAISQYPYLETFADTEVPELPFGYQTANFMEPEWQSTNLIGQDDKRSIVCYNLAGIVKSDYDNWLISPPFMLESGNEYYVSFYYKSFLPGNSESVSVYWGNSPYTEDLTNLLFEDTDFSDANFQQGEAMIIPAESGPIFLGYHVTSTQGYGAFFDVFEVADWGTVSTGPEKEAKEPLIYAYNGNVKIKADPSWQGANVRVMNMVGQMVYEGTYSGTMNIELKSQTTTGLYIVTMGDGQHAVSKKVLIK